MPNLTLYKTIFQARYKPTLRFYDLLNSAAQQLENEYPYWLTTRLKVVFKDYEKHCSLNIGHNALAYEQDSADVKMERDKIQRSLEVLPSALEINYFSRWGYLRHYLIHINMSIDSLVSVMHVKLFSQDSRLGRIMPEHTTDISYVVNSMEAPYQYHILVGPVRRHEVSRWVNFNKEQHLEEDAGQVEVKYQQIVESYPEVSVFIDIDFFQSGENLEADGIVSFVETAREKVHGLADDLCEYIFQTEIEEGIE